jgi:hypothetical protein
MWSKLAVAMVGVTVAGAAEAGVTVSARVHVRPVVVRPAAVVMRPAPVVVAPALRVHIGGPIVVGRGLGKLAVEVEPDRARVYIDGSYVGRGDTAKLLVAGTHSVRVVLSDGREARQSVRVTAGHLTRVTLDL